ncbi:esterase FE4-like [Photinus pyralis]|uniref:esterase FE4-like n=1 Tax=Photinus pyralis TaxID=7054 RepID=UPI00126719D0|nr:esterase FE4-like [Photinus pyralis]XP_031345691.1 esterase FE4-like [Photinus pyralis]
MYLVVLQITSFIYIFLANADNTLEIKVSQGRIRGVLTQTWTGKSFTSFTGIPYAKPPIGELRFEAPVPAEPWEDVLDATKYGSICLQDLLLLNITDVPGNEDCLYLNVYTPQRRLGGDRLVSVMFYNHGGGWMLGSGNDEWHGPGFLLDQDLVLVTYNYRLGPLGFISMGDDVVPGNNGLKDQVLALKWVKENIIAFGGDPNRITVFGNSAGGASTHFQTVSPLTRDLISGAILQSGTAFSPWALSSKERARNKSLTLAERFDCALSDSRLMIECLKTPSAMEITKASQKLYEWHKHSSIPFRPVIEHNIKNSFLPDHPANIIASGKAAKVPIMLSVTTEDGLLMSGGLFNHSEIFDQFTKNFEKNAPLALIYDDLTWTNKIRSFYVHGQEIDSKHTSEITKMFTDWWFFYPMYATAQMHARFLKENVFQLLYGYRAPRTYADKYGNDKHNYGVAHCDELLNFFTTTRYGIYHKSELDIRAVKTTTKLWENFARTGNPTPDSELPIWQPTTLENSNLYFIDNNVETRMVDNVFMDRIAFWEKLMNKKRNQNVEL